MQALTSQKNQNSSFVLNRRDRMNSWLSEIQEFYGEPIDKAIVYLHENLKMPFRKIAQVLYGDEVSGQAIMVRYQNSKKKGGEKNV